MRLFVLTSLGLLTSCGAAFQMEPGPAPTPVEPVPEPVPVVITPPKEPTECALMCDHLGKLGCEEGQPVYDSDRPGPQEVPNTTCEDFCLQSEERGASMNPRCVKLTPTCQLLETYRLKDPSTCTVE